MTLTDNISILNPSGENPALSFKSCPECSNSIIYDAKTYSHVCDTCGLVISTHNIVSHGRKAYTSYEQEARSHIGHPYSILNGPLHLSTKIEIKQNKYNAYFFRLKKINKSLDSHEKTQFDALIYLRMLSNAFNIPHHIKLFAFKLFLLAKKRNLICGRTIRDMMLACVYIAYRKHRIPITLHDLLQESDIKRNILIRHSTLLIQEFKIKIYPIKLIDLTWYLCSKFKLGFHLIKKIITLMKKIKNNLYLLSGKNPIGFLAAIIYIMMNEEGNRILQKEITDKLGLSLRTIRVRLMEIKKLIL